MSSGQSEHSHKNEAAQNWLARHTRVRFHHTPDQAHHFAAFFRLGFIAGALGDGNVEELARAYGVFSDLNNPGDRALAQKAIPAGRNYGNGSLLATDLAGWIDQNVCER